MRVASSDLAAKLDAPDLVKLTSEILTEIRHKGGVDGRPLSLKEIARASNLPDRRAKAILYPDHQKCKALPFSEIRSVLRYAKTYDDSENSGLAEFLHGRIQELRERINLYLRDDAIDEPKGIQEFLANYLSIDPAAQKKFSDVHSGCYLLVRCDAEGGTVISKMKIRRSTKSVPICHFQTVRNLAPKGKRIIDGYIYCFESHVYAIGCINSTGAIRCTILQPTLDGSGDMQGLRLGVSHLEKGPFAHRLYCRFLGKHEPKDGVEPFIKAWKSIDEARKSVNHLVPDIADIVAGLRDPYGSPYGMLIPPVR
jgi:hypothetical protein